MTHTPEDMTVTVDASATLSGLQSALAKSRQWLPLDPPNPSLTLREILDHNESGPRRYGYGTARDHVIGLSVELADGGIIRSGGRVVKNVAGYDLQKLFIGSRGALGTVREITFKLRPIPETERLVQQQFSSLDVAAPALEAVVESPLAPVILDLHDSPLTIVLGFDGAKEDVAWQVALAANLGFGEPASLGFDRSFRADTRSLRKFSVLPSQLCETLRRLGAEPFVARAGNGIIYHRATTCVSPPSASSIPRHLERRLKNAFDPQHRLPGWPA